MPKVHPSGAAAPEAATATADEVEAAVMTVWRKSLLFNCDGFTVFDAKGNLVFRVDSYGSGRHAEVVLMDVAGKPLLTIRRKKLSFAEQWIIYDGDGTVKPLLSVRRHVSLRSSKAIAHVTPLSSSASAAAAEAEAYVVEGSYGQRSCAVRNARGEAVVEVRRKESVGADVFRLVAEPRLGAPLAMGLVIALDGMFGGPWPAHGRRSLLPRSWSAP